jgi:hypothetical protein
MSAPAQNQRKANCHAAQYFEILQIAEFRAKKGFIHKKNNKKKGNRQKTSLCWNKALNSTNSLTQFKNILRTDALPL